MKIIRLTLATIAASLITGCQNTQQTSPNTNQTAQEEMNFSESKALESTQIKQTSPHFAELNGIAFTVVAESCKGQIITIHQIQILNLESDRDTPGYFRARVIAMQQEANATFYAFFKVEEISTVDAARAKGCKLTIKGMSLGRNPNGTALFKVTQIDDTSAQ